MFMNFSTITLVDVIYTNFAKAFEIVNENNLVNILKTLVMVKYFVFILVFSSNRIQIR